MGLDMYAYTVPAGQEINDNNTTELDYWRKFNALHGWMEDLYRDRGGDAESFNCIPLKLTEFDLMCLLSDVKENNLKPREGFFFGAQEIDEEDIRSIYTFVGAAQGALATGLDVYYDSWW
jgi:hypothetical protein